MVEGPVIDSWAFLLNYIEMGKEKMERFVFGTPCCTYWVSTVDNKSSEADFVTALDAWLSSTVVPISLQKLEQVKWVII